MMRSLFAGVSGLRTHQTKMDVIGNNIANVNTVGFKSSAVTFSDIMYQNMSGASGATETLGGKNANQIGLGVNTGSTKISIESGGAAQSTGQAFDIRLTDSNATNFFVVSNGSQNLFTRAGSFYVDGAGNLAMTSTGYMVMGWQVDPERPTEIKKDTVTPLRIMSPANQTSSPEPTKAAYVSGVLDKYDTNANNEDGYMMAVVVYDSLGYEYTAKFSVKTKNADNGEYTVSLSSITNDNNENLLDQFQANGGTLDQVFGSADGKANIKYDRTNNNEYPVDGGQITYTDTATNPATTYRLPNPPAVKEDAGIWYVTFDTVGDGTGTQRDLKIEDVFGISNASMTRYNDNGATYTINDSFGFEVEFNDINYDLRFKTNDGTLRGVGPLEEDSVMLNLSVLGPAFENVEIDFSSVLNYNNGGSSTMGLDRGLLRDPSVDAGRKLGTLIGLSVNQNGEIYGAYSNGKNQLLGQIAVAQFANPMGLESLGNNCYATTLNSGDFDGIGVDVTADGGSMNSGQLEMSNVDLSQEFTDMITTQRGFQANSRIITVSDTMLEELTNLKR